MNEEKIEQLSRIDVEQLKELRELERQEIEEANEREAKEANKHLKHLHECSDSLANSATGLTKKETKAMKKVMVSIYKEVKDTEVVYEKVPLSVKNAFSSDESIETFIDTVSAMRGVDVEDEPIYDLVIWARVILGRTLRRELYEGN